jgi:hypothetical protein
MQNESAIPLSGACCTTAFSYVFDTDTAIALTCFTSVTTTCSARAICVVAQNRDNPREKRICYSALWCCSTAFSYLNTDTVIALACFTSIATTCRAS